MKQRRLLWVVSLALLALITVVATAQDLPPLLPDETLIPPYISRN